MPARARDLAAPSLLRAQSSARDVPKAGLRDAMTLCPKRRNGRRRLRSDGDVAVDVGGYVARGSTPHERLDFLPIGETDHGFVESRGHKIRLGGLEGDAGGDAITDVLAVFCAAEPENDDFLMTGRITGPRCEAREQPWMGG